MINIAIIDDHPVSRWGLQRALETQSDITVTRLFESADDVRAGWLRDHKPDVMIVDLYLADDLPCIGTMAELAIEVPVLVVSASRRAGDIANCRQVGARGFLHKSCDADALVAAVRQICQGGTCFQGNEEADASLTALDALSPRERQVLAYIANGYTHDQAARRLGVSRHTVDTYMKRLRAKVGDGNKAHLTRMALLANVALDLGRT